MYSLSLEVEDVNVPGIPCLCRKRGNSLALVVVLLALAALLGQARVEVVTPLAVVGLAYQAVVVAFVSYLIWFWLLTRYMASRLSVFSFLTPLFGVTFGVLLLGESFSLRFLMAAGLVLAGIALVNAPARRSEVRA